MQADIFKDILVPVSGGLGILMFGLECMSNRIQSLAVNKIRNLLAKIAGTPLKGVLAGTLITGVIQSSTAIFQAAAASAEWNGARPRTSP